MVLRTVLKPVYLALFSLSLLAVIAGSGAVMVLAGKGRDVFLFGAGVAVGMSLVSALSLELWHLSRERFAAMQQAIVRAVAAIQLGEINPQLLLTHYATPQKASDIHLELECRRLLDRLHQLLAKAVSDDGYCPHCGIWGASHRRVPGACRAKALRAGQSKAGALARVQKDVAAGCDSIAVFEDCSKFKEILTMVMATFPKTDTARTTLFPYLTPCSPAPGIAAAASLNRPAPLSKRQRRLLAWVCGTAQAAAIALGLWASALPQTQPVVEVASKNNRSTRARSALGYPRL